MQYFFIVNMHFFLFKMILFHMTFPGLEMSLKYVPSFSRLGILVLQRNQEQSWKH